MNKVAKEIKQKENRKRKIGRILPEPTYLLAQTAQPTRGIPVFFAAPAHEAARWRAPPMRRPPPACLAGPSAFWMV